MNNKRRKEISKVIEQIEESRDTITDILNEEQEALDNMPESLIDSERGEQSQNAIDLLDDAISNLEEAIEHLEEAQE